MICKRASEEREGKGGLISLGDSCTSPLMSLIYLALPEGHLGCSAAQAKVVLFQEIERDSQYCNFP